MLLINQSIKKYNKFYGVDVPTHIGYKIPEMFDAALEGKLKALWIIGEDVVQTDPNTQKVMRALQATDLLVVQELFMTETAKLADVILPGASFLEKMAPLPMVNAGFRLYGRLWNQLPDRNRMDRSL